ncbi:MAG: flagellar biosynthesis protein [Bacteroidetes bacterium]|nr:MAG: flagellar biosynthesis protein [Bacteroidota bacterium]
MALNVRQLAARVEPGAATRPPARETTRTAPSAPRTSFADVLQQAREARRTPDFTLSAHAAQRVQQRGISLTPAQQDQIRDAFQQLEASGARDALLLRPDAAFVVNVPNRTVITAMNQAELQRRVFTNIDSALLL